MLSDVAKDALELAPMQRLTLARILLDVSETDQDFSEDVEEAWQQEIARRIQAVKGGTATSRNFDQVFADLDRCFPS
jgi:hypothetical protein